MISKNLFNRLISSFILIFLTFYIIINGSILFNCFILLVLIISLYEWHKMSYRNYYYIPGIIFLIISFYSAYLTRNYFYEFSVFNFLLILIICMFTDIGGFIFGKLLKGPKLIKISPNKTYSGAIGGLLLSIIASMIFLNISTEFYLKPVLSLKKTIITVIIISIISQIGDLIVSFFKRLSNIKDTGKIIPGHGGVLDRIDSMIFAFPICYYLKIL